MLSLVKKCAPSGIHKYVNWLFILSNIFSVVFNCSLLLSINDSKNCFVFSFFSNNSSFSGYVNSIIEPFFWLNDTTPIYTMGLEEWGSFL